MTDKDQVSAIAGLLRERNAIDEAIAGIIKRPMTSGHLGEWLAAQIFGIELEYSAVTNGIDGKFASGPLQGRTVNVKWYLKQEGLLDINRSSVLDYYLVLTGPRSVALTSRNSIRPWRIDSAYLFDARKLASEQLARGVKLGTASSVRAVQWDAAEIFPVQRNSILHLSQEQAGLLRQFAF